MKIVYTENIANILEVLTPDPWGTFPASHIEFSSSEFKELKRDNEFFPDYLMEKGYKITIKNDK